jgi:hypothetical protein
LKYSIELANRKIQLYANGTNDDCFDQDESKDGIVVFQIKKTVKNLDRVYWA